MLRLSALVLSAICLLAATPAAAAAPLGPPEYRALWVDAFHDGMKSPAQVEKLVADAKRANLNALLVQVRKRGDAYFNRSDEPRASDITGSRGFDPLAYVIRLAHAATPRIEVHAWVNTFFTGESSGVYLRHGDDWGNRSLDGQTGGFLDPGVPEAQIYLHRLFIDLALNYDVDGIHLDFIRYPDAGWGYSASAVSLYMIETGTTSPPDDADARWQAWRRARVTAFVRDLHHDLQLDKPSLKLSAALICYGGGPISAADWTRTSAYTSVYQDWRDWMVKGYLDFGVPMNYDSDWSPREKGWFGRWLGFEKDSGFAKRIVIGVGAFLNYPEDALAQMRRVLSASAAGNRVLGVAIYSYASTSVYGTDDFYGSPDLAGGLPRQPYAGGITTDAGLQARAKAFNDRFMTQLVQPDSYRDVQLGMVATQPVFTQPAATPTL
jgi:uncharacterized lipoprotein YddW (UPF0748 family)